MIDRLATVIWWIGALSMAAGLVGIFFNKPSEMWMPVALGGIPCAICFSLTYILAGSFSSPPVGPLSKRSG